MSQYFITNTRDWQNIIHLIKYTRVVNILYLTYPSSWDPRVDFDSLSKLLA